MTKFRGKRYFVDIELGGKLGIEWTGEDVHRRSLALSFDLSSSSIDSLFSDEMLRIQDVKHDGIFIDAERSRNCNIGSIPVTPLCRLVFSSAPSSSSSSTSSSSLARSYGIDGGWCSILSLSDDDLGLNGIAIKRTFKYAKIENNHSTNDCNP